MILRNVTDYFDSKDSCIPKGVQRAKMDFGAVEILQFVNECVMECN